MANVGQVTRLPFTSPNTNLLKVVVYDASPQLAAILAWPTLRAFFDFSDLATMTEISSQVATITGKKAGFVATAGVGERGTYGPVQMNGQPALTFAGAQGYKAASLMGTDTSVTWASCFMSTDSGSTSRMILTDAATSTQNLYVAGDNIAHFNGAAPLTVPGLRNRPVNVIWTMNYLTDAANIYADGLHSSGISNAAVMSGDANIGCWNDGVTTNRFIGHMGYLAVFAEDASANPTLRGLLDEYALRRWRL